MTAPFVVDAPIHGESFLLSLEQYSVSALAPGEKLPTEPRQAADIPRAGAGAAGLWPGMPNRFVAGLALTPAV